MSNTLPDVNLTGTAYQNLYAATGIAVGNPLIIQNKGINSVQIIISPTQPSASSNAGYTVYGSGDPCAVQIGASGVWAKSVGGSCVITVQAL